MAGKKDIQVPNLGKMILGGLSPAASAKQVKTPKNKQVKTPKNK